MPSQEHCQAVYDQLVWNGAPNAAKQMFGEAHYNPDFLAELPGIPDGLKAEMQACAGMTATKMIEDAAEKMTPREKQQSRAHAQTKLDEHIAAKGGKGKGVVQAPGATSSHAAYGEIIEVIDKEDGPFSFLKGEMWGIPKWAFWAAGGLIVYTVITKRPRR